MSDSISSVNMGRQSSQRGMNGQKENAHAITKTKSTTETVAEAAESTANVNEVNDTLTNKKLKKLQVEMSAEEIRTGSYMIGALLNIKV